MTEPMVASALATATNTPTAYAGTTTAGATATTDAGGQRFRLIRGLMGLNLGLVALQPVSAGFFLSGYGHALTAHTVVALALQIGAVVQAITAIVLWRRDRVPAWIAGISIGFFVMVLLQVGLGYNKRYWLHVPLGVAMFGWLMRQVHRLDTLRQTTGARS